MADSAEDEQHQRQQQQQQQQQEADEGDFFAWDEASQLYFHARSGFYHDPSVGWYYNSLDGSYYKFEDGNYVLLDPHESDTRGCRGCSNNPSPEQCDSGCGLGGVSYASPHGYEDVGDRIGLMEHNNDEAPENPPPTSEWLEDTLIDLYLSGYPHAAPSAADNVKLDLETEEEDNYSVLFDGGDNTHEREGAGQNVGCDMASNSSESVMSEAISWDEENWRAQYGQVIRHEGESVIDFPVVNLWDWALIQESKTDGKGEAVRLLGRLTQPSTKPHPSMPCSGGRLRTAPICEVNLDLVRVRSGQVYKLRSPSAGYLTTLSSYDASNPTKDWGFPELLVAGEGESDESTVVQVASNKKGHSESNRFPRSGKINHVYRDRAAERRVLHGGFGVGPGQKKSEIRGGESSSPVSTTTEEAASEALDLALGAGSYARRMLENMGWRVGEGLGKAKQGIKEPVTSVGNKGSAGLGWH
ncbi:hypothetical protein Dimus_004716 [Dionaea muscipula]